MNVKLETESLPASPRSAARTVFPVLFAISTVHLLNDTMQSTVSALFPVLRDALQLSYAQIGIIALVMNVTASLLQPVIGRLSDARPTPLILPLGVGCTLVGIAALALAPHYALILAAVTAIGVGSAVFHPESSRVAYLAAGDRRGLAQSIFQVGGNIGHAAGPIMTALLFVHTGQIGVLWLLPAAALAMTIQIYVARWYSANQHLRPQPQPQTKPPNPTPGVYVRKPTSRPVLWAMVILVVLVISKQAYVAGLSSYYTFFLIEGYGVSIRHSQWFLFAFLAAAAAGTFIGGPLADRVGRRNMIWFSILGTAPFSLLLPFANLFWSGVLAAAAGFILSSAFSIIVVYAQELLPHKIGFVSGLFFGLAFGVGGLGSALLGWFADYTSLMTMMIVLSFLPLLGILTAWLPKDARLREASAAES